MPSLRSGNETRANVAIIGGGVIGLSIARALRRRGITDITIVEKGDFGREASWAAGGILAPQVEADSANEFFRLACASRDMYQQFASGLEKESGVEVELDTTGTLYVGFNDADEAEFRRRFDWQRRKGLKVEWLDGDTARRLETCLSDRVRCALRFPDDYQVDNRKLVQALVRANENDGVRLISDCDVDRLQIEHSRVRGIETSQGAIKANTVVVAAGAWSSNLADIAVEPVRGQMLCFAAKPGFARHVIYSARGYLIPRHDGRLLAGSTTEHVGFDKRVTEEAITKIKDMAFEIAPAIESLLLIDSWAGFRPKANDGLPVLGRSSDIDELIYATGHYRNGILLAPVTGQLIAGVIAGKPESTLLRSFSPDRFQRHETSHAKTQSRKAKTAK
jgi:glycine oxidase